MRRQNVRHMTQRCLALLLLVLLLLPSSGAFSQDDQSGGEAESGTWEEIQALYETAKEKGEEVPKNVYEWIKQDLSRLGDWEYMVLDTEAADADTIEHALNELGTDRWECMWIQPAGTKFRLIMKRPAKSYLRHIPLAQLMKLISVGDSGGDG